MTMATDTGRFERTNWLVLAGTFTAFAVITFFRRFFPVEDLLAPIWPASGVLAVGLLLLDRKRQIILLVAVACVFLILAMLVPMGGRALTTPPEAVLLAVLTRLCVGRSLDFCDGRRLAAYVLGAALPTSIAATLVVLLITKTLGPAVPLTHVLDWFAAHVLGAALTVPSLVILIRARKYRLYTRSALEAAGTCALLIAYICACLWGQMPVSVLMAFPVALWIGFRYGPVGAAMLAIGLIGLSIAHAYLSMYGIVHAQLPTNWVRQFVTLVFLTSLPPAGIVATLRRTRTVLKQQTLTARTARRRADVAARSKAEFLANMSHEIRTPLNGVLGLADAISRTPLQADQRKMLDMIRASGQTLNRLLADSLDLARADSGVLKLEEKPFDLSDAVGAATFVFETLARDKAVEFRVELGNDCAYAPIGDALRIRQIVANLTGNAVKFTQTGHVHVTASLTPTGPGWSRLTVAIEDTGPGFDETAKKRMFTRFEQADDIARSHGGAGLGLAISQTLATMMGGVIECHSSEGQGSTFIFSVDLPLSDTAAWTAAEEGAAQPLAVARPLRILLAEDHPVNQQVVQILLGDHAQLTIVENGQEALDALESEAFDLVLMDTQMPVLDGVAATRELRSRERGSGRRTPVISLTASAMPQQVMAALEAGADLHLAKPITGAGLFGAIAQVMEAQPPVETGSASGTAAA